jgi:S1-C subfamily serine protease
LNVIELISKVRSGVAEIAVEKNRKFLGNGSAFLVEGGLVTNSHVIRPIGSVDAFRIRFEDLSEPIRMLPEDLYKNIKFESPEDEYDYAFIGIDEKEFEGRFRFELEKSYEISVGQQILFLGFPFGMPQLTAHLGYVSSIHEKRSREIIQIDGSVNGGNSGGPLLSIESGKVVGIITRAVTGIIELEFDNLISILQNNQKILSQPRASIDIGGIDPIEGIRASQSAMEQIARNLKRAANVGIGHAFSINPLFNQMKK